MEFDDFVGQIIKIVPNAYFHEFEGEVLISTGLTLKDNKLQPME